MVKCTETGCEILDSKTVIPVATRVECLYHLSCHSHHRRTGNFLPGGAVNHLPKKISQVAQIFMKESK